MRKVGVTAVVATGAALAAAVAIFGMSNLTPSQAKTPIPGTGVAMALPDGVVLAPFGTTDTNASRQILVTVMSGSTERDLATNANERALYPDPSEAFQSANLAGTLYKRRRSSDGGSWDGWWLNVVKGKNALAVMISYSGNAPSKFDELRRYLSTVTWDGTLGDPEIAFGLKLDVRGMELAHTGVGALLYTADGNVDWSQQHLYVFSIPGGLHGNMMAFHRICEAAGHQMFGEKSRTLMRYQAHDGIHVCDTWGQPGLIGSDYYAGLMLPDGSVIQATGLGNPSIFQHALLTLHRIPR